MRKYKNNEILWFVQKGNGHTKGTGIFIGDVHIVFCEYTAQCYNRATGEIYALMEEEAYEWLRENGIEGIMEEKLKDFEQGDVYQAINDYLWEEYLEYKREGKSINKEYERKY